jgi:hypothetical protein
MQVYFQTELSSSFMKMTTRHQFLYLTKEIYYRQGNENGLKNGKKIAKNILNLQNSAHSIVLSLKKCFIYRLKTNVF